MNWHYAIIIIKCARLCIYACTCEREAKRKLVQKQWRKGGARAYTLQWYRQWDTSKMIKRMKFFPLFHKKRANISLRLSACVYLTLFCSYCFGSFFSFEQFRFAVITLLVSKLNFKKTSKKSRMSITLKMNHPEKINEFIYIPLILFYASECFHAIWLNLKFCKLA